MAKENEWLARYYARQEQQKLYSEQLASYVVPALRFLGVRAVSFAFDGAGDSGDVQKAEFDGAPAAGLPEGLEELLDHACYYALPGGWEINAGSSGAWEIDVEEGTSDLEIEWHEEEDYDEGDSLEE